MRWFLGQSIFGIGVVGPTTALMAFLDGKATPREPPRGMYYRECLVAEAWGDGDTVPSLGATARQYSSASLGLHARAKAMHLGAVAAVGLEGTLGHRTVLIRESLPCGQVLSIADSVQIGQSPAIPAHTLPPRIPFRHLRSTGTRSASPRHATRALPSPSRIFSFPYTTCARASHFTPQLAAKPERLPGRVARLHKQWCNIFFDDKCCSPDASVCASIGSVHN